MIGAHGWSSAPPATRSKGCGRGCATLAVIVLILYGVGNVGQAIVPLSPGIRGNEGFYITIGLVFLLAAGAVWFRWLRPAGAGSDASAPRLRRIESHGVLKATVELLEDSLLPTESSTDLLQWAWLIRLDLAFREHLWVRIAALLASILVLFLIVPVILALLYDAGVLR